MVARLVVGARRPPAGVDCWVRGLVHRHPTITAVDEEAAVMCVVDDRRSRRGARLT